MEERDWIERFDAGNLSDGWRWFGAHPGKSGWTFRVWAPRARGVGVVGDFNGWKPGKNPLTSRGGVWEGALPGLREYDSYKYAVEGADGCIHFKADPYGVHAETRPATASKLYNLSGFVWADGDFLKERAARPIDTASLNIYEVHLGSWRRRENGDRYDYQSLAWEMAVYVKKMGYTAVELLPVMEHPLDGSWGYQCTGYFAPTSRFGTPNQNGGRENLEAVDFLKNLNCMVHKIFPYVWMIAEESTAWPMVTQPVGKGGLGFSFKWNMGWMNDICHYLKLDPWYRQYHHKDLTFSMIYAFSEHFILPLSHDEVVHMKGSLVNKMPGTYENQLCCLRGFYAYLLAHPGKKLLFMGAEIGQWHEWDSSGELDWSLLNYPENRKTQAFFRDANQFYQTQPALWEIDHDWAGVEWLVPDDNHNNVVVK